MKKITLILFLIIILTLAGCGNAVKTSSDGPAIDKELQEIKKSLTETPEEGETLKKDKTPIQPKKEDTNPTNVDKSKLKKLTVFETEGVALKLDAEDEDGDKISYIFSKPLNNVGKWKTTYGDAGEYVITVKASDGKLSSESNILLVVKKKNEAPVIERIANIKVTEGDIVKVKPKVKDINGDKVTVKIGLPLGDDGIWQTDHTSAGEYQLKVTATDGQATGTEAFLITVIDKNMPPEITNLKDITINEGEKVVIKPIVNDLDGDKVKVTISEPVSNSGVWQTGYKDHGDYIIQVRADDGKDVTQKNVKLKVIDINRPPEIKSIQLE